MSTTDTYAELVRRVEDLERVGAPRLRSGRGNVWGDNFGLAQALNMPRASVSRSTVQSIANGTSTAMVWNLVEYDTDGMWSSSQGNVLRCRTAGVFKVCAWGAFAANAAGFRQAYILKNGAQVRGQVTPAPSTIQTAFSTSVLIAMNANDYLELIVVQNAGGPLDISADGGIYLNGFQACLASTI